MRIHILSDLHSEFDTFTPAKAVADVIVLAGDISHKGRSIRWALNTFQEFNAPIIFVAGNHEFYGAEMDSAQKQFKEEAAASNGKLHYLDRQSVIINGVRFLGATTWTDFRLGGNPVMAKYDAGRGMNDYRKIRKAPDYRRLRPDDTETIAHNTRLWLQEQLSETFSGKTVLVTHHPITTGSMNPAHAHAPAAIDAAYYNAWEHLFFEPFAPVDLAIHGHTHFAVDYMVNRTRVISNPRGYPGQDTGFKPELVIEI